MVIQIDSREKARAIRKIEAEFDKQGIKHPISKLIVGDYMNYDNPRIIVDRKQSLTEVCGNMTQQHTRFRNELIRAQELGIQLVILVEHGGEIRTIDDVAQWVNPRRQQYCRKYGIPANGDVAANIAEFERHGGTRQPTTGNQLAKMMCTMSDRYGVRWEFCSKQDTGRRIIEILSDSV